VSLLGRIAQKGPAGVARAVGRRVARPLHLLRTAGAETYRAPTPADLLAIEAALRELGMPCTDYRADPAAFTAFKQRMGFPADYHGGPGGGVFEEKLLEHFVAWDLLGLQHDAARWPYVDIAGASSPWAKLLRAQGLAAWSIDLAPHPSLAGLPYYLKGDATASPFDAGSIGSASLQCAYEMFAGDADTRLLADLARVLKPGGLVVIAPLYMHVQACYYQSPEHHGRPVGDAGARRTLRRDAWDVAASRKYSAATLRQRVWLPALAAGLRPGLQVLRNAADMGPGIYLHFILTLAKEAP
jgi:SAM-dependent methyltransferase